MELKLNTKKSKLMTSKRTGLGINNEDTEVMGIFCLLGCTINSKGTGSQEILSTVYDC